MRELLLRSILAATDLTEGSDGILHAAGRLALASRAGLHVLHALESPAGGSPEHAPGSRPSFEDRIGEAVELLDEQIARTLPPGIPAASQQVVLGSAHLAILDRARDVEADLIVLGPHLRHGRADDFLGTTADRVIRSSGAPCLVVRGDLRLPVRRVLVPMDLTEPSRGALDLALAWAGALGTSAPEAGGLPTEIEVLHIVPAMPLPYDLALDRATVGPRPHEEVEAALARAEHGSSVAVREELVRGDSPEEEIVGYAEERPTDLLVLATHGRGALRRALLGSVASGVARRALCPVLLVPPTYWAGARSGAEAGAGGRATAPA